jgi:DNA-binding FrmR family transcriptional regulator
MSEKKCSYCGGSPKYKDTPRNEEEIKNLKSRLNRIIGQLNGVSSMLDENRYCGDILVQISAAEKALEQVGYMILKDHMSTCVVKDIKENKIDVIDETIDLMKKLK